MRSIQSTPCRRASGSRRNIKLLCPQQYHLPVLEPYLESSRDQLKHAPDVWQYLEAVTPKDLKQCSHQQLRTESRQFGAFYTRLADVARLPDPEPLYRPARLGLSSPLGTEKHGHYQSSSFSLSDGDPADKTDHILRTQHETVTAGMAAEFISAVVDLCSVQAQPDSRIEFTPAPTTYTMESQWLHVVCQDDGSFTRRSKSSFHGRWVSQGHLWLCWKQKLCTGLGAGMRMLPS